MMRARGPGCVGIRGRGRQVEVVMGLGASPHIRTTDALFDAVLVIRERLERGLVVRRPLRARRESSRNFRSVFVRD